MKTFLIHLNGHSIHAVAIPVSKTHFAKDDVYDMIGDNLPSDGACGVADGFSYVRIPQSKY